MASAKAAIERVQLEQLAIEHNAVEKPALALSRPSETENAPDSASIVSGPPAYQSEAAWNAVAQPYAEEATTRRQYAEALIYRRRGPWRRWFLSSMTIIEALMLAILGLRLAAPMLEKRMKDPYLFRTIVDLLVVYGLALMTVTSTNSRFYRKRFPNRPAATVGFSIAAVGFATIVIRVASLTQGFADAKNGRQ